MSQAKQSTTVKQTNNIDAKQPAQTQQSPELLAMWEQPYWVRQQTLQEPNVLNAAKVATLQRFVGNQRLGKSSYLARQPIHKPLTKQKVAGRGEEQQFTSNQQVIIQTQQSTAAQTSTTDDQQQSKQGYELGFFEKKLLSWAGVDPKVVMRLLSRAGGAVAHILKEPAKFINTVIRAIKQGFTQFKDKIGQHLQNGLVSWLFGSMSRAGIQLPKDFSPQSILSLVLQVLGITTDRLRQRVAKTIGEKNVQRVEKTWNVISTFVSQGLGGLWDMVKDYLGDLKEMVISEVKSWLITQVIQAAIGRILAMFNPVSGLFVAIKAIYNVVKFLIERASQIQALFQAVTGSIVSLIQGDSETAANKIEQSLARLIPVVIGFLASLLNINGITDKIREIIKRIQGKVDKAIDAMIAKVAAGGKALFARVTGKPSTTKPTQSTAQTGTPDAISKETTAKETVKTALTTKMPKGASQLAQVNTVLAGVAPQVKPILLNLHAEEVQPGKPKNEGAIGYKVKAKASSGKELLIAAVRYSKEGAVLSNQERWQIGVQGVNRALTSLEKQGISEETIKEQFPKWESQFGFAPLSLKVTQTTWIIDGSIINRMTVAEKKRKNAEENDDESLMKAKTIFKRRLFLPKEMKAEMKISLGQSERLIAKWVNTKILFRLATRPGEDLTPAPLYSFSPEKADTSNYSGKRNYYGYKNPPKYSELGRRILIKGLASAPPKGESPPYSLNYHLKKARYQDWESPGPKFDISDAILGHKLGASNHWNKYGHKLSKAKNQEYNRSEHAYGGPEHKKDSSASGNDAPLFRIPTKITGSHDDWTA